MFEVAKAAGVTPGALQHHFGSKAVLMMRVIHEILRASGAEGVRWPAPQVPLPERARRLVKALWERVYEPPRFLAAWSVYFGANTDEQVREFIASQRAGLAATLRERFAATFPELGGGADTDALADLVLSALRGIGVARLFEPAPARSAPGRPGPTDPREPRSGSFGSLGDASAAGKGAHSTAAQLRALADLITLRCRSAPPRNRTRRKKP